MEIAASLLGLEAEDARAKIAFGAPEVLLASDPHRCARLATALGEAGLSVAVVDGASLAKIPWPRLASSLAFGTAGLVAETDDGVVQIRYDEPVLGVSCAPPADLRAPAPGKSLAPEGDDSPAARGLRLAESLEWMSHLNFFFTRDGEAQRIVIGRDLTDFSGLVDGQTAEECMAATVTECRQRFSRLSLDTRLEDVRPRARFLLGIEDFDYDLRKAYSFGTLLLRTVLDSVSPELTDLTQYELGARISSALHAE